MAYHLEYGPRRHQDIFDVFAIRAFVVVRASFRAPAQSLDGLGRQTPPREAVPVHLQLLQEHLVVVSQEDQESPSRAHPFLRGPVQSPLCTRESTMEVLIPYHPALHLHTQ